MPDFDLENACRGHENYLIAGVDEAGRGPWAGPVTAAAVIWPPTGPPSEVARLIDDSKALSAAKRRVALREIEQHALIAVGWATVAEIDEHNILAATFMAMRRAIDAISKQMGRPIDLALVDGNRAPDLPCTVRTVIKGDAKSYSIAAASIVAKEARDRHMAKLALRHPGYGWERNAGYGTAEHRAALTRSGVTLAHRSSFKPVRARLLADTITTSQGG